MALVKPIRLQHTDPSTQIYAAIFTDLQNAAFLRAQLLAGNTEFSYALIDARSILSTSHLFAAVFRALNDDRAGRLKSRNVHSEIVFSLSPNSNIADSFRRFGIADDTKDLIVIKIYDHSSHSESVAHASITAHLSANIKAKPIPFTDAAIVAASDLEYIGKLYKVPLAHPNAQRNPGAAGPTQTTSNLGMNGHDPNHESHARRKQIETVALGAMALKGS